MVLPRTPVPMPYSEPSAPDPIHALYQAHQPWLLGWLRRRMGNAFDAADLSQDTWVRLIVSRRLPQGEEPRAYLVQIAKGLVVDLLRRRRLEAAYLEALALLPEPQMPSPQDRAIALQTLVRIDAMLDALPPRVREVFMLSQFEGLTYAEIAPRVGAAERTVRKHMRDALQACFQALME